MDEEIEEHEHLDVDEEDIEQLKKYISIKIQQNMSSHKPVLNTIRRQKKSALAQVEP